MVKKYKKDYVMYVRTNALIIPITAHNVFKIEITVTLK